VHNGKRLLLVVGVGVYLFGLGALCGTMIERMRFDRQREVVLTRYEQVIRDWKSFRMALEKHAVTRAEHGQ